MVKSSLLSSTRVQTQLHEHRTSPSSVETIKDDLSLLLTSSEQTSKSNIHRLTFSATAFTFTDPSPECQTLNPLLGIRFDLCHRTGRYTKPYHLFCRRVSASSQDLHIHRHTIPSFVPLSDYEKQYLPVIDEGYGGSEDSYLSNTDCPKTQDLHALVKRVRQDLLSWRLRLEAIDLLRELLELPAPKSNSGDGLGAGNEDDSEIDEDEGMSDHEPESCGKFGVQQLEVCSPDGSQARILWSDDRVGRIKLSREGGIAKAAVFSGAGRLGEQERILASDSATIYDFAKRLEALHESL
jgi:central kinetochore subunit Mal2/MCM21